jgi:hypothetical protein
MLRTGCSKIEAVLRFRPRFRTRLELARAVSCAVSARLRVARTALCATVAAASSAATTTASATTATLATISMISAVATLIAHAFCSRRLLCRFGLRC